MSRLSMNSVMEYLLDRCSDEAVAVPALADILDRLIWCVDDNGAELLQVRERWLQSGERKKVLLALCMEETYPFGSLHEMENKFRGIGERWPDLISRCERMLDERRQQEKKDQ